MELHFMFVLLRGAVGRILCLSPSCCPPPSARFPPASVGDRSSPWLAQLCGGCRGSGLPPAPCPPLGTNVLPCLGGAGMCRGLVSRRAGSAHLPPHLCLPPKPHRGASTGCVASQTRSCPLSGAEEPAQEQGGCSSPGTQSCPPGWGHSVSPTRARPSPSATANSGWTLSALNPCRTLLLPGSGAGRAVLPCPPLPAQTHPAGTGSISPEQERRFPARAAAAESRGAALRPDFPLQAHEAEISPWETAGFCMCQDVLESIPVENPQAAPG